MDNEVETSGGLMKGRWFVNLVLLALSNLHRKWIDLSKPNLDTI